MFGPKINLFKVFGIQISIDWSWFILVLLITSTLALITFPSFLSTDHPEITPTTYWIMGAAGALGLFVSILLHELGHALVAERFGVPMRGITLFIFGGVAEMSQEPPSAKAEFFVAIAGPIVSIAIAVALFAGVAFFPWPTGETWVAVSGVIGWLAIINGLLVAFNMLPAFPLDGGRVLRSVLWHFKGSLRWATRITSRIGSGFGLAFIVLGAASVLFTGNLIGGIWWIVIGMFLRSAAQASYQQLLMRRALEGEPLERFMRTDVATVPPDISLQELVSDHVLREHHKMFPVTTNGHVIGCISTRDLQKVPREQWEALQVGEVAQPCTPENTISPQADATDALAKMSRTGNSRLMVVSGDKLIGILSLKDMLRFISLKVELEEGVTGEDTRRAGLVE